MTFLAIAALLLCAFILFFVVKLNKGTPLREWDWIDWLRILVALYWVFVSLKLGLGFTLGPNGHTLIYPGVILTLALIAGGSIRKEKRVHGNGIH